MTNTERRAAYRKHLEEKVEELDRMAAEARDNGNTDVAAMCTDYRIEIQYELAHARYMEAN